MQGDRDRLNKREHLREVGDIVYPQLGVFLYALNLFLRQVLHEFHERKTCCVWRDTYEKQRLERKRNNKQNRKLLLAYRPLNQQSTRLARGIPCPSGYSLSTRESSVGDIFFGP